MSAHEKLKILKMVANRGVYDELEGLVPKYDYADVSLQRHRPAGHEHAC